MVNEHQVIITPTIICFEKTSIDFRKDGNEATTASRGIDAGSPLALQAACQHLLRRDATVCQRKRLDLDHRRVCPQHLASPDGSGGFLRWHYRANPPASHLRQPASVCSTGVANAHLTAAVEQTDARKRAVSRNPICATAGRKSVIFGCRRSDTNNPTPSPQAPLPLSTQEERGAVSWRIGLPRTG